MNNVEQKIGFFCYMQCMKGQVQHGRLLGRNPALIEVNDKLSYWVQCSQDWGSSASLRPDSDTTHLGNIFSKSSSTEISEVTWRVKYHSVSESGSWSG